MKKESRIKQLKTWENEFIIKLDKATTQGTRHSIVEAIEDIRKSLEGLEGIKI